MVDKEKAYNDTETVINDIYLVDSLNKEIVNLNQMLQIITQAPTILTLT